MNKTAGIIIIGDEILTGKVQDRNSHFLAEGLWSRGVPVRRISVIPDEVGAIGTEVAEFSRSFDYVFTSGGIGPTHDDVTIDGICKGFGVGCIVSGTMKSMLEKHYGNLTPAQLRMAMIPEGAEIVTEGLSFPLIIFRNVYIFPGIPEYLRSRFLAVAARFSGPAIYLRRIYLDEWESRLAPLLDAVVALYPMVKIGSYPAVDRQDYKVMVTLESTDRQRLDKAASDLLARAPSRIVVAVEGQ